MFGLYLHYFHSPLQAAPQPRRSHRPSTLVKLDEETLRLLPRGSSPFVEALAQLSDNCGSSRLPSFDIVPIEQTDGQLRRLKPRGGLSEGIFAELLVQ